MKTLPAMTESHAGYFENFGAIEKAARLIGGKAKLACLIGVKPPTVQQWLNGDRPVPIDRAVQIEAATSGAVTRKDLRPNDWAQIWPELTKAA